MKNLSIGLGIILNQLKNYFKQWFGKSHLNFILKEKKMEFNSRMRSEIKAIEIIKNDWLLFILIEMLIFIMNDFFIFKF